MRRLHNVASPVYRYWIWSFEVASAVGLWLCSSALRSALGEHFSESADDYTFTPDVGVMIRLSLP